MTVRINFLPRSYRPPRPMGRQASLLIAGAAVAVLAAAVFYGQIYAGLVGMEQQAEADRAALQAVKAKLAEAADLKRREERAAAVEADLQLLKGRQWSAVLLTLRQLTPQHVAWTSLKAEKNQIVLKGTSRGMVELAQLVVGLAMEISIEQVSLQYVTEKGVPVTVTVKGGQKEVPELLAAGGGFRQLEFELTIALSDGKGV